MNTSSGDPPSSFIDPLGVPIPHPSGFPEYPLLGTVIDEGTEAGGGGGARG